MSRSLRAVRPALAWLAIAALSLSVAACGSDEEGGDLSGGLSGDPIRVMTLYTSGTPSLNTEEVKVAAEAATRYINENGGVDGRPLEIDVCNGKVDPNATMACVQQAIDDDVVAILGGECQFGDAVFPVLEEAGIPWIGTFQRTEADNTSPNSYPVLAPNAGAFGAQGQVAHEEGADKVSIIRVDVASAVQVAAVVEQTVEAAGGTAGAEVVVAPDAADFGPAVEQASGGGEGLAVLLGSQATAPLIKAIRDAGLDADEFPVSVNSAGLPADLTSTLDVSYTDDLLVVDLVPLAADDPQLAEYADLMRDEDSDVNVTSRAVSTFLSYLTLDNLAESLDGEVAASTVRNVLDEGGPVDTGWGDPIDFGKPTPLNESLQRVFRSTYYLSTFQGGEQEAVREVELAR